MASKPVWCSIPVVSDLFLRKHSSTASAFCAGMPDDQASPNIKSLAAHLQQEWDHAANAHLGGIAITAPSRRKVWWSNGMCKTGQPHRWQAKIFNRSNGQGCPYDAGKAVCPCNSLAHNHPEVAAEWDWEANAERTPGTVAAGSSIKAAWRCGPCGHRWSAIVRDRTQGTGCRECAREARCSETRQPTISDGAPHLLTGLDWEANATLGRHPDRIILSSGQKVHWVVYDECKLGLVHRWQASPDKRIGKGCGSPFPSGSSVCACNSLAVQCPEAAYLWDFASNGGLTPSDVAVQSHKVVAWKHLNGRQWRQMVQHVVRMVWRQRFSPINQQS